MTIKIVFQALVLSLGVSLVSGAAAQPAGEAKAKAGFQVGDGDAAKWSLVLNNARSVQQDLGADKVQIEFVAYGLGIGMLTADSLVSNRVAEAARSGVEMVACENTLTAQKIAKADMNPSISHVPAGVVRLMKRQSQGRACIRP